ncbi:MAG: sugar ABC transporter permease [Chthonomonadales bacterium]
MNSRRESRMALLFVAPWIVGFSLFLLYPLVASVIYSFCDYSVLKPAVYIGADNYREILSDELFWTSLKNTLVYAAMALPATAITALGLAILLNCKVKGIAAFRTMFFIPSLVPVVAVAVIWQFILNGQHGLLNAFLSLFHVRGPDWLGDPAWSKPALALIAAWAVGNPMVIYLAGLQDIPVQLYEAADLDGAKWFSKTRHITLPMLSPVILFNMIMGIISTLQIFTVPYVLDNQGAPAHSIYFYSMYLFDNAFVYNKMGYASAMGWIMFLIIVTLTFAALKFSDRHVHYSGG